MRKSLLALATALLASSSAYAGTLTIIAPPSTVNFDALNDYTGMTGSFGIAMGLITANADVVHVPNAPIMGNDNAYILLSPMFNPILPGLQEHSHGADFTLTLDTPTKTFSVLMADIEPSNAVQFGIGVDTVTILGSQMLGLNDALVTFTSETPFDRIQVHDIDEPIGPETYARFQFGELTGAVPETSTWLMLIMGFCGLGYASCSARRVKAQRLS